MIKSTLVVFSPFYFFRVHFLVMMLQLILARGHKETLCTADNALDGWMDIYIYIYKI